MIYYVDDFIEVIKGYSPTTKITVNGCEIDSVNFGKGDSVDITCLSAKTESDYENEMYDLKEKNSDLEKECEKLSNENSELENEIVELKDEIKELELENDNLKSEIDSLKFEDRSTDSENSLF